MSRNPPRQSQYDATMGILKVGVASGFVGFLYGGVHGIIKGVPNPAVHISAQSMHKFACGASFWWLRNNILRIHYEDKPTSQQHTYASIISAGVAGGGVTKLMGGRFFPSLILYSLLGGSGQLAYNAIDKWQLEQANTPYVPFLQRMANSKWIPLKSLSDDEYRHMLGEKLLSIDADIALVDEKIGELERAKSERGEALQLEGPAGGETR